MILLTDTKLNWLIGLLCVSLAILVLTIAYRKLLRYYGKGQPLKENYCVLYGLEIFPATGELQFYFTTEITRFVTFEILNKDMSFNQELVAKEFDEGGHIIRFDSTVLENGEYFYCLRTENQKTVKKMLVKNA